MGLYLEKIEENEKKIKKLKATIETSKAKLKKLVDENAHLSYLEIKAEYGTKISDILRAENLLTVPKIEGYESGKWSVNYDSDSENVNTAIVKGDTVIHTFYHIIIKYTYKNDSGTEVEGQISAPLGNTLSYELMYDIYELNDLRDSIDQSSNGSDPTKQRVWLDINGNFVDINSEAPVREATEKYGAPLKFKLANKADLG